MKNLLQSTGVPVSLEEPGASQAKRLVPSGLEAVSRRALEKLQDSLFLSTVVGLSVALYTGRLGFYMDDWGFLKYFAFSGSTSVAGLFQALYVPDHLMHERPLQALYMAVLYRLFGMEPLGYHLVNAGVLAATALLFYLALRELQLPRWLAVALPLVFILLPNYSSDRFWMATFQATLSVCLFLLGVYAFLRGAARQGWGRWSWALLALAALAAASLAYELVLPFYPFIPLLLAYRMRLSAVEAGVPPGSRLGRWLFRLSIIPVFAVLVVYKLGFTALLGVSTDPKAHLIYLVTGSLATNFGTYGIGLPLVIAWILSHQPSAATLLLSLGLALGIFGYLFHLLPENSSLPGRRTWLVMGGISLVVFALGYGVFLASHDIWFTSTSIGNRTAIAASLGVSGVFVAAAGFASTFFQPGRKQRLFFSALVTLVCLSGLLVINTLAEGWINAYHQEKRIVTEIQQRIPNPSADAVIVLDGACLADRGAYIFTGSQDIGGRLRIAYRNPTMQASAVTHPVDLAGDQLALLVNNRYRYFPYSESLLVYNDKSKEVQPLPNRDAALQYFARSNFNPETDCPPGFAWGINER